MTNCQHGGTWLPDGIRACALFTLHGGLPTYISRQGCAACAGHETDTWLSEQITLALAYRIAAGDCGACGKTTMTIDQARERLLARVGAERMAELLAPAAPCPDCAPVTYTQAELAAAKARRDAARSGAGYQPANPSPRHTAQADTRTDSPRHIAPAKTRTDSPHHADPLMPLKTYRHAICAGRPGVRQPCEHQRQGVPPAELHCAVAGIINPAFSREHCPAFKW